MANDSMTATKGRPRQFDEEKVLDQALELFWRDGYRATTTRDLEAALGLSQSSIYNAFGSKYDLLIAALDRYEKQIDDELLRPLERSGGGLEAVDRFFADLGHWVTHDGRKGCMIINLMAEDGGETDEIRTRTRVYRSRVRSALRVAIAATMDEDAAIDLRADLLMGVVLGLNIAARSGASPAELRRLIAGARYQIAAWHPVQPAAG